MSLVKSGVCHCGLAMEEHTVWCGCSSPRDMGIEIAGSELDAYRRGFEAARAAAANLCRKSEESLRSQAERAGETNDSLESMAEACFCLAEEIESLKPEASQ